MGPGHNGASPSQRLSTQIAQLPPLNMHVYGVICLSVLGVSALLFLIVLEVHP